MAVQFQPNPITTNTDEDKKTGRLYNPYQNLQLPLQFGYNLPSSPEFLFLEESIADRRTWGENLTYYTGIGYLAGGSVGAGVGFFSGVRSIEATDTFKLKINRILNGSGQVGGLFGKRCGIVGLIYAGLESGMVAYRDKDDIINSVVAGLGTGALYRAANGPRSAVVAGVIGGLVGGLSVTAKQAFKLYVPVL